MHSCEATCCVELFFLFLGCFLFLEFIPHHQSFVVLIVSFVQQIGEQEQRAGQQQRGIKDSPNLYPRSSLVTRSCWSAPHST
jgi:hypothetical protein